MCNFLSFVVTEHDIYTFDNSNSHTDIIEHHKLVDDPAKILKVEITPPSSNIAAPASKWTYGIDQDILPAWHTEDPAATEKRVRRAVSSWMRLRPWWAKTSKIISEYKDIPWMKPDGKPDPSWKLFTAPTWDAARRIAQYVAWDAERGAVRDAARRPAGNVTWDAAREVARDVAGNAAREVAWEVTWDAARKAARDAVGNVTWDAAWDAALDATLDAVWRGICGDLDIDPKQREHVTARMEVWRKGYCLLCDVDGELYVYAATPEK